MIPTLVGVATIRGFQTNAIIFITTDEDLAYGKIGK